MVTMLTSPQNNVKAKATARQRSPKPRPRPQTPRPQPQFAAALPVPDNAQRMNEHYFYEALKYSQPI